MVLKKSLMIPAALWRSVVGGTAATAIAAGVLLSPAALVAPVSEARAQAGFSVSFGYFYNELAPHGTWHSHPRWGDVWRPRVPADFRPYYRGHWEYTNPYGWLWVSDDAWGDIAFHYGRWVYDPFDGWLWIPGYVWAPAWVVWRSGGGHIGWFAMPPDDDFLYGGGNPYFNRWDNWNRGFGYADWYGPSFGLNTLLSFWIFVDERRFAERDYIRYVAPRNTYTTIVNNTTNITNYVTVNNYIVNQSIDVTRIERAAGRRIAPVEARNVLRRNASITTVDQGSRVQQDERRQHGGNRNASARERIVALPESRARAISPPLENRQDRERIERLTQPPGAGRAGKGGNENVERERPARPEIERGRAGPGPDIERGRAGPNVGPGQPRNLQNEPRNQAIERRAGPNEAVTQRNREPRVEPPRPQAVQQQQRPRAEEAPQGGGAEKRIDRRQQADDNEKRAGRAKER